MSPTTGRDNMTPATLQAPEVTVVPMRDAKTRTQFRFQGTVLTYPEVSKGGEAAHVAVMLETGACGFGSDANAATANMLGMLRAVLRFDVTKRDFSVRRWFERSASDFNNSALLRRMSGGFDEKPARSYTLSVLDGLTAMLELKTCALKQAEPQTTVAK